MAESRILKSWLDAYMVYTASQEAPSCFHLWTAMAVLAGALNRGVWMDRGYEKLYPNLYVVLVGPTGIGKNAASDAGVDRFLRRVDHTRILHEKVTPEGLIKFLRAAPIENKEALKFKQDCTAFIYAPELSVFLGNQSYISGLIELLTTLYGSKDKWDYTTATRGKENITNVTLNMFGGSNPEWLARGLQEDSFGGGFMGRCIFIYGEKRRKKTAWLSLSEEQKGLGLALQSDLHKIARLQGEMCPTPEAYDYYESWYNEQPDKVSGRLSGYYKRKRVHILKIAMLLSANYTDSLLIEAPYIRMAIKMLDEVEANLPEAFAYVGATNEAKVAQHIIEALKETNGIATRKLLLSKIRHMLRSSREFDIIIQTLNEAGVIGVFYKQGKTIYTLTAMHPETEQPTIETDATSTTNGNNVTKEF